MLLLLGEDPMTDFRNFIPKFSLFLIASRLKLLMSETYFSIHPPRMKVLKKKNEGGDDIPLLNL